MKGIGTRDAIILLLVVGFAAWVIYGLVQGTVTTSQDDSTIGS